MEEGHVVAVLKKEGERVAVRANDVFTLVNRLHFIKLALPGAVLRSRLPDRSMSAATATKMARKAGTSEGTSAGPKAYGNEMIVDVRSLAKSRCHLGVRLLRLSRGEEWPFELHREEEPSVLGHHRPPKTDQSPSSSPPWPSGSDTASVKMSSSCRPPLLGIRLRVSDQIGCAVSPTSVRPE